VVLTQILCCYILSSIIGLNSLHLTKKKKNKKREKKKRKKKRKAKDDSEAVLEGELESTKRSEGSICHMLKVE
jgi:hypothetical protein